MRKIRKNNFLLGVFMVASIGKFSAQSMLKKDSIITVFEAYYEAYNQKKFKKAADFFCNSWSEYKKNWEQDLKEQYKEYGRSLNFKIQEINDVDSNQLGILYEVNIQAYFKEQNETANFYIGMCEGAFKVYRNSSIFLTNDTNKLNSTKEGLKGLFDEFMPKYEDCPNVDFKVDSIKFRVGSDKESMQNVYRKALLSKGFRFDSYYYIDEKNNLPDVLPFQIKTTPPKPLIFGTDTTALITQNSCINIKMLTEMLQKNNSHKDKPLYLNFGFNFDKDAMLINGIWKFQILTKDGVLLKEAEIELEFTNLKK